MSNRQERRRRKVVLVEDDGKLMAITADGSGVLVEGDQFHKIWGAEPTVKPGEHIWALFAMFRINPEKMADGPALMDTENLITVSGPGCYVCEQVYTKEIAAKRCPGDPS